MAPNSSKPSIMIRNGSKRPDTLQRALKTTQNGFKQPVVLWYDPKQPKCYKTAQTSPKRPETLLKRSEMLCTARKHSKMLQNAPKHSEKLWNNLKTWLVKALDVLKRPETTRNSLKRPGTILIDPNTQKLTETLRNTWNWPKTLQNFLKWPENGLRQPDKIVWIVIISPKRSLMAQNVPKHSEMFQNTLKQPITAWFGQECSKMTLNSPKWPETLPNAPKWSNTLLKKPETTPKRSGTARNG